jgi:hypothetical protein
MADLRAAINNGLDRGQEISSIKQSLINAGYALNEIEQAFQESNYSSQKTTQPESQPLTKKKFSLFKKKPSKKNETRNTTQIPNTNQSLPQQKKEKKSNKLVIILLIVISILIILGAGFLGVYWEQLLGY